MNKQKRSAVIISASSDIGYALSKRWSAYGWDVVGTYRTESDNVSDLMNSKVRLVPCDLMENGSISKACAELNRMCNAWDVLVLCPGTLKPVGPFTECNFNEWENSVNINFIKQMNIVHHLLPSRKTAEVNLPHVLFFAGGGTNGAPLNYSAYIVSKIALIKMTELLDAEISDTCFSIIGPGWVKTKIHQETLSAGESAGMNYKRTVDTLQCEEFLTPMERVMDHCDWIVDMDKKMVGGRNFSTFYDAWGSEELSRQLQEDGNIYKLRRCGNSWPEKDINSES